MWQELFKSTQAIIFLWLSRLSRLQTLFKNPYRMKQAQDFSRTKAKKAVKVNCWNLLILILDLSFSVFVNFALTLVNLIKNAYVPYKNGGRTFKFSIRKKAKQEISSIIENHNSWLISLFKKSSTIYFSFNGPHIKKFSYFSGNKNKYMYLYMYLLYFENILVRMFRSTHSSQDLFLTNLL